MSESDRVGDGVLDFETFYAREIGDASDGRLFERAVAWWLTADPVYAAQIRQAWLWDDWPGRWGPDIGIDIVAETWAGELWAVQAKAYDVQRPVPKTEIDSFMSAATRPEFSHRLLVTGSWSLGRNARSVFEAHTDRAYACRSTLVESKVDWQAFLDGITGTALPRKVLDSHQEEAVRAVLAGFGSADRGQLIMACGTGKTLTSLRIVESSGAQRILALFPSLLLLQQSMHEWLAETCLRPSPIAVCSDDKVRRSEDTPRVHTAELGIRVTTDPSRLAEFMNGPASVEAPRIIFATYQSSPVIAEAQRLGAPPFDFAVADEAHRCATASDGAFRTILDDSLITARKRLFMTATPRIYAEHVKARACKRAEAEGWDLDVISMDDEEQFGRVMHSLALKEAIERDILTDYRIVVIGCLEAEAAALISSGRLVQSTTEASAGGATDDEVRDARSIARAIALVKSMRDFGMHRSITFHSRVLYAKRFASLLPGVAAAIPADARPDGDLWCRHVSGEMPTDQRKRVLNQLRDLPDDMNGVVSNSQCLKEGVDVPTLDGIAFIDPRSSTIDIVQAVGRALRKVRGSDSRDPGTILIPVVVREDEDPEQVIETSEFNRVWDVIRALRSHDDALAQEINNVRFELGKNGYAATTTHLTRLDFDLPGRIDIEALSRAIELRVIERIGDRWQHGYGALVAFVAREHHSAVPPTNREGGINLAAWVSTQRSAYNARPRRLISQERIDILEQVEGWDWTFSDAEWRQRYRALLAFVAREHHTSVWRTHQEGDIYLGTWVNTQRNAYHAIPRQISQERIDLLEQVDGWVWNAADAASAAFRVGVDAIIESAGPEVVDDVIRNFSEPGWQQAYAALLTYVAREHDARVPHTHQEGDINLGRWVSFQQEAYKNHSLNQERIDLLEQVEGWVWDARRA